MGKIHSKQVRDESHDWVKFVYSGKSLGEKVSLNLNKS